LRNFVNNCRQRKRLKEKGRALPAIYFSLFVVFHGLLSSSIMHVPRRRGLGVDFASFFYNTVCAPRNHHSSFIIHHSLPASYWFIFARIRGSASSYISLIKSSEKLNVRSSSFRPSILSKSRTLACSMSFP